MENALLKQRYCSYACSQCAYRERVKQRPGAAVQSPLPTVPPAPSKAPPSDK
jgi:hypothetical protein